MGRRPRSESEFREKLESEGWFTTFVPTTPGDIDILASKPAFTTECTFYIIEAWKVKERSGDYLYLRDKYDRILAFQERTGVPVRLAVKWKNKGGKPPLWWRGEPKRKLTRADCMHAKK